MKKIIKEFCDFYKIDSEMIYDIEIIPSKILSESQLKITWNKLTEKQHVIREKLCEKIFRR